MCTGSCLHRPLPLHLPAKRPFFMVNRSSGCVTTSRACRFAWHSSTRSSAGLGWEQLAGSALRKGNSRYRKEGGKLSAPATEVPMQSKVDFLDCRACRTVVQRESTWGQRRALLQPSLRGAKCKFQQNQDCSVWSTETKKGCKSHQTKGPLGPADSGHTDAFGKPRSRAGRQTALPCY